MEQQYTGTEELTLKELILAVRDYFKYFLRKWYWFVLGGLVLGGLFFYQAYTEPVYYSAPLTFLLNEDSKKAFGPDALLGSLGLSTAEQGGGKAAKLMELSTSRKVAARVLFDSTVVEGKSRLIADHLIDYFDYHDLWKDNERFAGFAFGTGAPQTDDLIGNSVFKMLYGRMIREEEGILSVEVDQFSGLFTLQANTPQPELSIAITEKAYAELTGYFINASISTKKESLVLLSQRADSVRIELSAVENRLARFQDRIARIPLQQERVRQQQLQREAVILGTMYAEIIKNRETAAFLLENERPGFELVDAPLQPLTAQRGDWKNKLIIGGLIGVILVGMILFTRKLVKDAMKQ